MTKNRKKTPKLQAIVSSLGLRVSSLGLRVRVWGLGVRCRDLGFRGLGFRVWVME